MAGVREKGGRPVLVTPIVRRWFNEDNTHTSVHGATVYAGLVRDALAARHLVPKALVRVG